jgi:hypothetical protein
MKDKYTRLLMPIAIAILVAIVSWLLFNKQNADEANNLNMLSDESGWLDSIKKETMSRTVQAKLLIQNHFPKHDLIVLSSRPAPGGVLILTTSINSKKRTFIVLPDNRNFIEGVLNSPYLYTSEITPSHTSLTQEQATKNTQQINKYEDLKDEFKSVASLPSKSNLTVKTKHLSNTKIKEAFIMPERTTGIPQATKRDLLEQTKLLDAVVFGNETAPSVYVFFDFQCPACLVAHKTLNKLFLNGSIKIHYIPVAALGNESVIKSAYTLISPDNDKRKIVFNHLRKQIPLKKLITTIAPESQLKIGLAATLKNKKTFMSLPSPATPTLLYEHNGISYISTVSSIADIKKVVQLLNN